MEPHVCHVFSQEPEAAHEQITFDRSQQREVVLAATPHHESLATQLELPARMP